MWKLRRRAGVLAMTAAVTAGAAGLAPGQYDDENEFGRWSIDEFGYEPTLVEMESRVEVEGKVAAEHTVEMEGQVLAVESEDAVGVVDELEVVAAEDEDGESILGQVKRRRSSSRDPDVNAFHALRAASEVDTVELTANPYRIASLRAKATVLFAEDRETIKVSSTPSEDFTDAPGGVRLRVRALRIDRGNARIEVVFERTAGLGKPFIEAVAALDRDGEVLGGGRWTEGSPFGDKGDIEAVFSLKGSGIAELEVTVVTEHEVRDIELDARHIFQK